MIYEKYKYFFRKLHRPLLHHKIFTIQRHRINGLSCNPVASALYLHQNVLTSLYLQPRQFPYLIFPTHNPQFPFQYCLPLLFFYFVLYFLLLTLSISLFFSFLQLLSNRTTRRSS